MQPGEWQLAFALNAGGGEDTEACCQRGFACDCQQGGFANARITVYDARLAVLLAAGEHAVQCGEFALAAVEARLFRTRRGGHAPIMTARVPRSAAERRNPPRNRVPRPWRKLCAEVRPTAT